MVKSTRVDVVLIISDFFPVGRRGDAIDGGRDGGENFHSPIKNYFILSYMKCILKANLFRNNTPIATFGILG